jgi:ketosteroid isomerase-like protein
MKNRIPVAIFMSVCVLFVPLVAQQVTDAQKVEIEKALTEAYEEIVDGLNNMDIGLILKYIGEDFQERVGSGMISIGATKEWMDGFLNAGLYRTSRQNYVQDILKIHILSPDFAYVVQAGGISYVREGRHGGAGLITTHIWRKEQNGWKIIHIHESKW